VAAIGPAKRVAKSSTRTPANAPGGELTDGFSVLILGVPLCETTFHTVPGVERFGQGVSVDIYRQAEYGYALRNSL